MARALFAEPAVVFADEPTGALDAESAERLLDVLREAVAELGQTVVLVTHDLAVADLAAAGPRAARREAGSATLMRSRSVLLDLLRSQLRRHPGRAVTLGVTVALAVTLLTSSFVLAASLRTAIDQGLKVSLDGVDVVVRTELGTSDSELSGAGGAGLRLLRRRPQLADLDDLEGVQASASYTRATAVARTGETVLGISLESLASDQSFQWQRWDEGRAPTPGQPEIGLTRHTLEQLHIRLGDLVSIGNPGAGCRQLQGHRRRRRARLPGVLERRLRHRPRGDGAAVRRSHRRQRRAAAHGARHRRRTACWPASTRPARAVSPRPRRS